MDSYYKNFDDVYSTDIDDAPQSFSARFAIPYSKVFDNEDYEVISDDDSNVMSA